MTSLTPWLERLGQTPVAERKALLESLVVAEFKRQLMMDETDVIPRQQSYFELGLTSLGATETKHQLESEIGRPFDSAYLFNHPTIGHLVDFLTTEVLPDFFPAPESADGAAHHAAAPAQQSSAATKDLVNDVLKELYQ